MKEYKVKINCPGFFKDQIIQTFEEVKNEKIVHTYVWSRTWINVLDYPEIFEVIKKPLTVTEDGVEIFDENEIVWYTVGENKYYNSLKHFFKKDSDINSSIKIFSTPEAAIDYIKNNRPYFTKQQIRDAIKNATSGTNPMVAVKSHLNKELGL